MLDSQAAAAAAAPFLRLLRCGSSRRRREASSLERTAARIQPLRMDLYSLRREDLAAAVRILVSPVRCEKRWRCIWRRREHEAEVLRPLLVLHGSDTSAVNN
ncbi:unnamed protein product [Urochloa humidicola]